MPHSSFYQLVYSCVSCCDGCLLRQRLVKRKAVLKCFFRTSGINEKFRVGCPDENVLAQGTGHTQTLRMTPAFFCYTQPTRSLRVISSAVLTALQSMQNTEKVPCVHLSNAVANV